VVAIADKTFADFQEKIKKQFPKREFKFVGTDLSNDNPENGYMATIKKETADLDIGVVFSNAGFIRIGVSRQQNTNK
jgi:NADP-dependent 3-hydroxy acid dehydrogenase YdfG